MRAQLVLMCVMTAALGLVNAGFTTALMLITARDLAILGGLLVFSLGISVFVAFTLSDATSRSIGEVLATLRSINTGNLDVRVTVRSRDQVGEMAQAVNAMAQRLETSLSRERDVDRARHDLIRSVSHDLRTPLASIRAMVESINDGVVSDPATVNRYLRSMQSETENLSELINDLFELSQMDAGALQLHMEPASLEDLISDTIAGMSAQARTNGVALDGRVDEELPAVSMDTQRVQRVLNNLVHNAIRHTSPEGKVFIDAHNLGHEVQVDVIDNGEGIPKEEVSRILDVSNGLTGSRNWASIGSGLGLSIATRIVEAHGGRFWLESEEGEGSTFSFTLNKSTASGSQPL